MPTVEFLDDFANAWNRHGTDAILSAMTADCIMQLGVGPDVGGSRFEGAESVRKAVDKVFSRTPDIQFNGPKHFVSGDRGLTEWVMTATTPKGSIEVEGCDVFTFRDGKIAFKNSYTKQRNSSVEEKPRATKHRVRVPDGISNLNLIDGSPLLVPPDRIVEVSADDAAAFGMKGWERL
jgi:ketosteroid isomerase-like protein